MNCIMPMQSCLVQFLLDFRTSSEHVITGMLSVLLNIFLKIIKKTIRK